MGKLAIVCGLILVALGLGSYFGVTARDTSTLLPAIFGVLLCVSGGIAIGYPKARMHAMHVAVLIALFEFVASLLKALAAMRAEASVTIPVLVLLVCAIFVIMSVRSFIEARRQRVSGIEGAPGASL